MEENRIAVALEEKQGTKGAYHVVKWKDGGTDNIFNADWLPLINQSIEKQLILHTVKEPASNPKYNNIVKLELTKYETSAVSTEPPQTAPKPTNMTKDDWVDKDRTTRKSIERQVCLKCAVDLAVAKVIETSQVLPYAKKFEAYLNENPLVEAAKKLGATEE